MPNVYSWMLGANNTSENTPSLYETTLILTIADLLVVNDERGLEKSLMNIIKGWLGENAVDIARHEGINITVLLVDADEHQDLTIDLGMLASSISEVTAPQMECMPIIEMRRELKDKQMPRSLNIHITP